MQKGSFSILGLALCFVTFSALASKSFAESSDAPASFLPTWKLLNNEAKQQFISGYIQGWRDAERVTEIALDYVKENPQKAVEGLEKIKSLYDMRGLAPGDLIKALDAFYSLTENREASLSQAVSAAKQALR